MFPYVIQWHSGRVETQYAQLHSTKKIPTIIQHGCKLEVVKKNNHNQVLTGGRVPYHNFSSRFQTEHNTMIIRKSQNDMHAQRGLKSRNEPTRSISWTPTVPNPTNTYNQGLIEVGFIWKQFKNPKSTSQQNFYKSYNINHLSMSPTKSISFSILNKTTNIHNQAWQNFEILDTFQEL